MTTWKLGGVCQETTEMEKHSLNKDIFFIYLASLPRFSSNLGPIVGMETWQARLNTDTPAFQATYVYTMWPIELLAAYPIWGIYVQEKFHDT